MNIRCSHEPDLKTPTLVAAWPGMGYLAKISVDYLRRRLDAKKFAEIKFYQNAIIYKDSLATIPSIRHRFFAVPDKDLIICVGDAQPSIPEEAIKLAEEIAEFAKSLNVKRVYTMAAYPSDYPDEPRVYGVFTDESLRDELEGHGVEFIDGEGAVNGLNGVLIGVAKSKDIDGVCLMGEIRYANVPQHLSSKAVLKRLTSLLGIEIDTTQLVKRAEKIDASIRKSLNELQEIDVELKEEKKIRYIS